MPGKGFEPGEVRIRHAQPAPAGAEAAPKGATQFTKEINAMFLKVLPFDDRQDFEDAQKGFIAPLYDGGVVKDKDGKLLYDAGKYTFPLDEAAHSEIRRRLDAPNPHHAFAE